LLLIFQDGGIIAIEDGSEDTLRVDTGGFPVMQIGNLKLVSFLPPILDGKNTSLIWTGIM
jgi:hypothetical protein